ncbi:integrase catalytic subunit [Corynebacterium vitaeruminis DSM 20294]|uniref:Integrase catalytic subunit n=11 Tax=Corynebacterium vitaeruminis TaxID=38305 RepID=W5Y0E2_9CORY|nr:integrase catalytic subunit [Corynebacterium vitaeruminis DSM 20294]
MSRKATSGDNAVAEGFFGMLKRDLFPTARACENYTIAELIRKIDQYIDWYNNRRVKAGLGYKTIKQNREEYSRQTQAA